MARRKARSKAQPFSIRLREDDDRFVEEEARRLQRPKGAIIEAYASEGIKARRFPGISFRGEDYRRRAWAVGTGLDVWEIVALLRDFGSVKALAGEYELTEGQIRIALAYRDAFPEEIDELVARGRRSPEEALQRYPFLTTFEHAVSAER
ncbi:MAG: hypothetical protein ACRDNX_10310 [Gaiellaceae bacterium]